MAKPRANSVVNNLPSHPAKGETKPEPGAFKRRAESMPPGNRPVMKRTKASPGITGPSEDEDMYARRARILLRKDEASLKTQESWATLSPDCQNGMRNETYVACYRNSLFQALFHVPSLVTWFLAHPAREHCRAANPKLCLSCHLHHLATLYWSGGKPNIINSQLATIQKLVGNLGWQLMRQHDPDDFYRFLLRKMQNEMQSRLFGSFVSLQKLVLAQTIKCNACCHESKRKSEEQVLPLSALASLDDSLASFMFEKVEGWRCDRCNVKSNISSKILSIERSPEVLVVLLNRFITWNGVKNSSKMDIPLTLNLNKHRSVANRANTAYDLYAVVKHQGARTNCGHYTCVAKGPDGAWHRFDDSQSVNPVHAGRVTKHDGGEPYLLFYQRKAEKRLTSLVRGKNLCC